MPDPFDPTITKDNQKQEELKIPRQDILELVGLSEETAQKLAQEESQNVIRLRSSYDSGQTIYDQLKSGQEVTVVTIGSGQFPISPQTNPTDFIKVCVARTSEIKPQPPVDEVKKLLEGFADKALADAPKDFYSAIHAFNFVADGNLKQDEELFKKLIGVARTDQEKYHLAKALEEVIPAESQVQMAPKTETDQLYNNLRPQNQAQPQQQPPTQPEQTHPQEIKKPYLPFANYKPPVDTQNNLNQPYPANGQTQTLANEPNLRPVPPRPSVKLAQDIDAG